MGEGTDMAYSGKRIAVFGVIGLIMAASIIFTIQVLPLPESPFIPDPQTPDPQTPDPEVPDGSTPEVPMAHAGGVLVLKVIDAPAKELQNLFLRIDNAIVHRAGNGSWLNLPVIATEPFDLLTLNEASPLMLAVAALPTGNYTEIRLHVNNANATIDGLNQSLRVVANGWLKVKVHFTIAETAVTIATVDIQVNPKPIVNAHILHPVVKADIVYTSTPEPTVLPPEPEEPEIEQVSYQWAADNSTDNPTPLAAENTPISNVTRTGAVLRLRLALRNSGSANWSAVPAIHLTLQYSLNLTDWTDVGMGVWRYANGSGLDGEQVSTLLLTGSTVAEHFVESTPTAPIIEVPVDGQGEWDICLTSDGASPEETYAFRFVLEDGTPFDLYSAYPTLTTASASDSNRNLEGS